MQRVASKLGFLAFVPFVFTPARLSEYREERRALVRRLKGAYSGEVCRCTHIAPGENQLWRRRCVHMCGKNIGSEWNGCNDEELFCLSEKENDRREGWLISSSHVRAMDFSCLRNVTHHPRHAHARAIASIYIPFFLFTTYIITNLSKFISLLV